MAQRSADAAKLGAEAADRSSKAAEKSAQAAQDAVLTNRDIAAGVADRAKADALAKRYVDAAEQLGAQAISKRRAGVYALARLADDWHEQRQQCVDLLCGYLRDNPIPDPALLPATGDVPADQQVRLSIVGVLNEHLAADCDPGTTWSDLQINLDGATLHDFKLDRCLITGRLHINGCRFTGHAELSRIEVVGQLEIERFEIGHRLDLSSIVLPGPKGSLSFSGNVPHKTMLFVNEIKKETRDSNFDSKLVVVEGDAVIVLVDPPSRVAFWHWDVKSTGSVSVTTQEVLNGEDPPEDYKGLPAGELINWTVEEGGWLRIRTPLIANRQVLWSPRRRIEQRGVDLAWFEPDSYDPDK